MNSRQLMDIAMAKENVLLFREVRKISKAIKALFGDVCEIIVLDGSDDRIVVFVENPKYEYKIGKSLSDKRKLLSRVCVQKDVDFIMDTRNESDKLSKKIEVTIRNSKDEIATRLFINLDMSSMIKFNDELTKIINFPAQDFKVNEKMIADVENRDGTVRNAIRKYSIDFNKDTSVMKGRERDDLIVYLHNMGALDAWGAIKETAKILNISRATIYNAIRKKSVMTKRKD